MRQLVRKCQEYVFKCLLLPFVQVSDHSPVNVVVDVVFVYTLSHSVPIVLDDMHGFVESNHAVEQLDDQHLLDAVAEVQVLIALNRLPAHQVDRQ